MTAVHEDGHFIPTLSVNRDTESMTSLTSVARLPILPLSWFLFFSENPCSTPVDRCERCANVEGESYRDQFCQDRLHEESAARDLFSAHQSVKTLQSPVTLPLGIVTLDYSHLFLKTPVCGLLMGVCLTPRNIAAKVKAHFSQLDLMKKQLPQSRSTPIRTSRFSFYGQGFPHEVELATSVVAEPGLTLTRSLGPQG